MESRRHYVLMFGALAGLVIVMVGSFVFSDGLAGRILFDRQSQFFYPLTVQNIMWVIFCVGTADALFRNNIARQEARQLSCGLLPEDPTAVVRAKDLEEVYRQIMTNQAAREYFLQRSIMRIILQFQSSRSVDQARATLNSCLDLALHEVDLKYTLLRYISWLLPTIGFIGTVVGIAMAMNQMGESADSSDPAFLMNITSALGVAFYTTLLALVLSAILVFLHTFVQAREEMSINSSVTYCIDNLINRLYDKS